MNCSADLISDVIGRITGTDSAAENAARDRWRKIAKPLGGLGRLEEAVVRLAGIRRTARPEISRRGVVIMCADNGVVREGVSQAGQEVTRIVADNFTLGRTCCSLIAGRAGADVFPVDIGIAEDSRIALNDDSLKTVRPGGRENAVDASLEQCEKLQEASRAAEGGTADPVFHGKCSDLRKKVMIDDRRIARGTADMLVEPAMTRNQAEAAILTGYQKACELADIGYEILAIGEMGIGNTTTASAVASVLLGLAPEDVTGRGSGLTDEGLRRKEEVIRAAIALHRPDAGDPVDTLAKVGGFDIAGMAGLYLGCAARGVAAVADGLISLTAALAAVRLCPKAGQYIFASHRPAEPAGDALISTLRLQPMLDCGIALGEGAGAVMLFPVLDMALEVYDNMCTFEDIAVEQYTNTVEVRR